MLSVKSPVLIRYGAAMPTKVFYAWQSDLDEKVNHYLIRDAIQLAIDELKADARIEEAPEIDHDTKDVPGTPDIANTISQKIKAAGAFIADVTGVVKYATHDERTKQTPNANVMIELGLAIRRIKWKRILLVMNTEFGDVDLLPFDLKNRSRPVTYSLAAGAPRSEREVAKKQLAAKLKAKLILIMKDIAKDAERHSLAESDINAVRIVELNDVRQRFEVDVARGEFHELAPIKAIFAVSIQPIARHENVIVLPLKKSPELVPLGSTEHGTRDLFANGVISYDWKLFESRRQRVSVTEVTRNGIVFAADNWKKADRDQAEMIDGPADEFILYDHEPNAMGNIARFIKALRTINVSGPLSIGLSILNTNNCKYWYDRGFLSSDRPPRVVTSEVIRARAVTIESDQEVSSANAVAVALRPALDEIWQECGHDYDYYFQDDGTYLPGRFSGQYNY